MRFLVDSDIIEPIKKTYEDRVVTTLRHWQETIALKQFPNLNALENTPSNGPILHFFVVKIRLQGFVPTIKC